MKIGIVVSFFDFRNDVRKLVNFLSSTHDVVLFVLPEHVELVGQHNPNQIEIRIIIEKKENIFSKIWQKIYYYFKLIPASRQNFFLMELFKIYNGVSEQYREAAIKKLKVLMKLPKIISYDRYLSGLSFLGKTKIDDIDKFICFTDINNDYFFARLIKEQCNIAVYVYSWDHPCKHFRFSNQVNYFVWDEGIKQDLVALQNINPSRIRVIGSLQFTYIYDYLNSTSYSSINKFPFDYVYFGCAIGIDSLVPQEIEVIKILSETIRELLPSYKLVVRPYPVLSNWRHYDTLNTLSNVLIDGDYRRKDLSVAEDAIFSKFDTIQHAKAFFHLGTTLGLEASFMETPSFIIDFGYPKGELSLEPFIHQYQNDKYLIDKAPGNAIDSLAKLEEVLQNLSSTLYMDNNSKINADYVLKSLEAFTKDLL